MRRLVLGDVHGRIEALKEVLKKSKFDYKKDRLIVLGDIADGGYDTYQVVEELLKIDNLIYIVGNHDEFFLNHIKSGWAENIWLSQGGVNTLKSYGARVKDAEDYIINDSYIDTRDMNIPVTHQEFFNRGKYYHIEDEMLFVHGGIDPKLPMSKQKKHTLLWDRDIIRYARKIGTIPNYRKVFIGHTTTESIAGVTFPVRYNNLYLLDCGAGWSGRLAIMDIDTEEYWLSEIQKPAIRRK